MATKADMGVYLPHYMDLNLNWQTFNDSSLELFPGLHLIHSPGHTPGLAVMMLHLKNSGTFILTTDQYHVKENFEGTPQGWLARDHSKIDRSALCVLIDVLRTDAWFRSHCMIKRLHQQYDAKICFGHDLENLKSFKANPEFYS